MEGAEYIPPEMRERLSEELEPDERSEFEDDGAGYCLNCRQEQAVHVAGRDCPTTKG